jgi:hypothetical protein
MLDRICLLLARLRDQCIVRRLPKLRQQRVAAPGRFYLRFLEVAAAGAALCLFVVRLRRRNSARHTQHAERP